MVSEDEAKLQSLEKMMKFLIIGDSTELKLHCERFLTANLHNAESHDEIGVITEAYNIAYNIKVLLRYIYIVIKNACMSLIAFFLNRVAISPDSKWLLQAAYHCHYLIAVYWKQQ
jgi:hypothetical protein